MIRWKFRKREIQKTLSHYDQGLCQENNEDGDYSSQLPSSFFSLKACLKSFNFNQNVI